MDSPRLFLQVLNSLCHHTLTYSRMNGYSIRTGLFQVSIAHGINDPYRYEKTSHGNTVVCDYRFHIQGRFHGPYREYCLGMLMLPRNKSDTNICMFRKASMGRLFASSRLSMYSGSRII